MMDILGYEPDDLNGKSVYDYHHSVDSRTLSQDFKCCECLLLIIICKILIKITLTYEKFTDQILF